MKLDYHRILIFTPVWGGETTEFNGNLEVKLIEFRLALKLPTPERKVRLYFPFSSSPFEKETKITRSTIKPPTFLYTRNNTPHPISKVSLEKV